MKYLAYLSFALALALPAAAEAPAFAKAGQTYVVLYPGEKSMVVRLEQDQGGGWWRVALPGSTAPAYINLGAAIMMTPGTPTTLAAVAEASVKRAITNNLRQLAAASDQYYLENGVAQVAAKELIGPQQYIKSLKSVDGEEYDSLVLRQGQLIKVKTRSGMEVSYEP